jgi:hypothetical protein
MFSNIFSMDSSDINSTKSFNRSRGIRTENIYVCILSINFNIIDDIWSPEMEQFYKTKAYPKNTYVITCEIRDFQNTESLSRNCMGRGHSSTC